MIVTFIYFVVVLAIELVLGMALALLLDSDEPGFGLLRALLTLTLVIPPAITGMMFLLIEDPEFGVLSYLLETLGILDSTTPILATSSTALAGVMLADIWQWTPFIFIIVIAGLQALPKEVLEAASIDGTNWWQQIFFVKLPMIRSILLIALLMRLIDVFRALEVMYIMTGGGPGRATELLSLHIYKRAFDAQQLGYASAISVLLIVIVFSLSFAILMWGNPMKDKSDL